ncbi:hypothetical protein [Myceligenerans crystallogenes]|uniref:KOW motif-containing protein n=1 Tax=Myceligenerans crystallogenes TaxID=316335 RepID=A0ABN2NL42_9MICO
MRGEISKDDAVEVTGPSNIERGTEGVVESVRRGWTGREAVIVVPGFRPRKVAIPISDLTKK